MPSAHVLFDVISYRSADGDRFSAVKGEVVDLTAEEFKRLEDLDAVEKATAKDVKAAAAEDDAA